MVNLKLETESNDESDWLLLDLQGSLNSTESEDVHKIATLSNDKKVNLMKSFCVSTKLVT
jgi:hypothetical protein